MKSFILLAFLVCSMVGMSMGGVDGWTCSATVVLHARDGATWFEGPIQYQIYDIIVHNVGSCALYGLSLFVDTFPLGVGEIIQGEHFDPSSGELYFPGVLAPDQIFSGAGFIVAGPPSTTPFILNFSPKCKCAVFETCEGVATIHARNGGGWFEEGKFHHIWDISVTNTGSLKIAAAILTIDFPPLADDTEDHWNIEKIEDDKYALLSHSTLYPGHTFTGAGFLLKSVGPKYPPPLVALYTMVCI